MSRRVAFKVIHISFVHNTFVLIFYSFFLSRLINKTRTHRNYIPINLLYFSVLWYVLYVPRCRRMICYIKYTQQHIFVRDVNRRSPIQKIKWKKKTSNVIFYRKIIDRLQRQSFFFFFWSLYKLARIMSQTKFVRYW